MANPFLNPIDENYKFVKPSRNDPTARDYWEEYDLKKRDERYFKRSVKHPKRNQERKTSVPGLFGFSMDKRKKKSRNLAAFPDSDNKLKPWGNFDLPKEKRKPLISKPKIEQIKKIEKAEKQAFKKIESGGLKRLTSILRNRKITDIKKLEYLDKETGEIRSLKGRLKGFFTREKKEVIKNEYPKPDKKVKTKKREIGKFDAYTNKLAKKYTNQAAKSLYKTTFGDLRLF